MQRIGERLLFSPSDLNHFLECEHLTQLDLERDPGRPRNERDPQAFIPGNRMAFAGISEKAQRDDLIAYIAVAAGDAKKN